MAFEFKENKTPSAKPLSAVILGPSGGGKSFLTGTMGVKTLYLHTTGEDHGASSLDAAGADFHAECIDYDNGPLSADQAMARLHEILASVDSIKKAGFKAIAVDGATELCHIIRQTTEWKNACKTKDGGHNNFAENDATTTALRKVTLALRNLQRQLGIHVVITCGLDVRSTGDLGEIEEATPRLPGYSVAESLIQTWGDTLVVGRMTKDDVTKHKLQFLVDVKKVSKDENKRVKKAINFNPRIEGVPVDLLPPFMNASLAEVIELKKKKGKK